jgi:hypothetical protein
MRSCGFSIGLLGGLIGSLAASAATGCTSGPTLSVTVHHRAGYVIKQTVITVYAGDAVTCTEIKYGDRTPIELAAITAEEVDVTSGGVIDVSRTGSKVLVARGYDVRHRFVTAGCYDLGPLVGETQITIDTEPTAVVAVDPGQPEQPFDGRPILVNMTDANGLPLTPKTGGADAIVSWQLIGPAAPGGVTDPPPAAGLAPNSTGDVTIKVADLGVPGPEALRIRAPWATTPLPVVTGFDLDARHTTSVPLTGGGSVAARVACDLRGHAGKLPSLVCLTQATIGGHRDMFDLAWQTDHYVGSQFTIPTGIDNAFALVVDHDPTAVDEAVYAITSTSAVAGSIYRIGTPATSAIAIALSGPIQNVAYIAKCTGSSQPALLGVESGTALTPVTRYYVLPGTAVGTAIDGELFSGGCVSDVDGTQHQAVVASEGLGTPSLYLVQPQSGVHTAVTAVKLTGSGFLRITSNGVTEQRFVGTRFAAAGTVVFEAVLAPVGSGNYKLVERSELDAAAAPSKILSGQLDQDGDTDLMWDVPLGRRRLFQVALAKLVGDAPLSAITAGPYNTAATTSAQPPDFFVADLNGGGLDDMILVSPTTVTIYAAD